MIVFPGVITAEDFLALPEITFFVTAQNLYEINKSKGLVTYKEDDDIYSDVEHYYCGAYEYFGKNGKGQTVNHSKYILFDYEIVDSLTIKYGDRDTLRLSSSTIEFSDQNDLKDYIRFIEERNEFIKRMCDEVVVKAKETIDIGFEADDLHSACNSMRESLTDVIFENNTLFDLLRLSFGQVSLAAKIYLRMPVAVKRDLYQLIKINNNVEDLYRQLLDWIKNASELFGNTFTGVDEQTATLAVYLLVYRGVLDYYSKVWINEYDKTPITIDPEHYIYECVERHTVGTTDGRSIAALVGYLLDTGAFFDNYRIPYDYVTNCIEKAENKEPLSTPRKEIKEVKKEHSAKVAYDSNDTNVKEPSALDELNSLVGLESVKNDVIQLASLVQMNMKRKEKGLPTIPVSLHLVFTGNPGTGKTTVARILAKLYKEIGVLPKGQLVEVDRSGLVAGYVGQTALKTNEKIQEAMGGVLFIDEAYSLSKEGQDFGQEAIDTILKAMEDFRDEFVVIVAGYPELMKTFINSNPGLRSRFNKYISFVDYNEQELLQIFIDMCQKYHLILDAEAYGKVKDRVAVLVSKKDDNFANARDIRNLFEVIVTNQARRLAFSDNVTDEDMTCIRAEDIY